MKQQKTRIFMIAVAAISLVLTLAASLNTKSLGGTPVHAQTGYPVSGRITGTGGEPIGGLGVFIVNGLGASETVNTDANGVFVSANPNVTRRGYYYAVRPNTPSGYVAPAIPQTLSWSFNTGSGLDTQTTDVYYENQLAGSNDCAGPDINGVTGRCNYAFALAPVSPPAPPPAPVASTGSGASGYQGYTRYSLDCINGLSVSSTYTPDPANPLLPNIYYNVEVVSSQAQAGLGKGTLIAQDVQPNGATFATQNVVAAAAGPIQFYVYTIRENTDPMTQYTIHGLNGTAEVSAAPADPPPQPYTLSCPTGGAQPPGPVGGLPPPVVALPPADVGSTVKKDMVITFRIFLPGAPRGQVGNTNPSVSSIPVDISIINGDHADDNESVSISMNSLGAGLWEGKYTTSHYPGTRFAVTIWPKKHMRKTICHVGITSPHVLYPTTYQCSESQGTIVLKSGANYLDFSRVEIGAGDVNTAKTHNGTVDSQDLFQINQYLKQPDRNDADAADLNFDGLVNQQDYDLAVWSLQNIPQ